MASRTRLLPATIQTGMTDSVSRPHCGGDVRGDDGEVEESLTQFASKPQNFDVVTSPVVLIPCMTSIDLGYVLAIRSCLSVNPLKVFRGFSPVTVAWSHQIKY